MMINVEAFYQQLGAAQALGPDEHIVLEGSVRVSCTDGGWTAIFEGLSPSEDRLDAAFEICRTVGGLLPFTTRSGPLAVKRPAAATQDETAEAMRGLQAVMRHLGQGAPSASG
jgi:hypothetical protein